MHGHFIEGVSDVAVQWEGRRFLLRSYKIVFSLLLLGNRFRTHVCSTNFFRIVARFNFSSSFESITSTCKKNEMSENLPQGVRVK